MVQRRRKRRGILFRETIDCYFDRYFVTEDANAASRRATASLARLTESSAPAAASWAVLADWAAWLAEFCAFVAAAAARCALDPASQDALSVCVLLHHPA